LWKSDEQETEFLPRALSERRAAILYGEESLIRIICFSISFDMHLGAAEIRPRKHTARLQLNDAGGGGWRVFSREALYYSFSALRE
jgi:hypothetical protein